MHFGLALKALFCDRKTAERLKSALKPPALESSVSTDQPPPTAVEKKTPPGRSDALTLVSTLQREARLLDLVQEPLEGYTDAQVGAAARDVLRDTSQTLKRLFNIVRLAEAVEGERIELPNEPFSARWRIVGPSPNGNRVTLVHAGWQATKCDLPRWTGDASDALVLAPAEVEA
jgi:Domain of unknown function (DUF2760)